MTNFFYCGLFEKPLVDVTLAQAMECFKRNIYCDDCPFIEKLEEVNDDEDE